MSSTRLSLLPASKLHEVSTSRWPRRHPGTAVASASGSGREARHAPFKRHGLSACGLPFEVSRALAPIALPLAPAPHRDSPGA
eukprot:1021705-Pyramimonas_sp.AAC.1